MQFADSENAVNFAKKISSTLLHSKNMKKYKFVKRHVEARPLMLNSKNVDKLVREIHLQSDSSIKCQISDISVVKTRSN